jgi:hypothetical protein
MKQNLPIVIALLIVILIVFIKSGASVCVAPEAGVSGDNVVVHDRIACE